MTILVQIGDVETGECLVVLRVEGELQSCAWCRNGSVLIAVRLHGIYMLRFVTA